MSYHHSLAGIALGTAILLTGCGTSDEAPTVGSIASQTAEANVATQSVDVVDEAINYALSTNGEQLSAVAVNTIEHPHLGMWSAGRLPGRWVYVVNDIDFTDPQNINQDVDLDEVDENGFDRFPHATGTLNITAVIDSSTMSDSTTGRISFNPITVTYTSDITVIDPRTNNSAWWPQNTAMTGSASLDWQRTDRINWQYEVVTTKNVTNKTVVIARDRDGEIFDGLVNANWTGYRKRERDETSWSAERDINGSRTVYWERRSDGRNRTVQWQVNSLEDMALYINDDLVFSGDFSGMRSLHGSLVRE